MVKWERLMGGWKNGRRNEYRVNGGKMRNLILEDRGKDDAKTLQPPNYIWR